MCSVRLFWNMDDNIPLLPPGGEFLPSRHADCGPGCPLSLALPFGTFWQGQGNDITDHRSGTHIIVHKEK